MLLGSLMVIYAQKQLTACPLQAAHFSSDGNLIDLVVIVVSRHGVFRKESGSRYGFVFERQPEFSDLLVTPHEVRSFDPKRRDLCGLALDLNDCKLGGVDPDFPREQILVGSRWIGFGRPRQ